MFPSFAFFIFYNLLELFRGRPSGALNSGSNSPSSSPGRGNCVVFLGKTLNSLSATLRPGE